MCPQFGVAPYAPKQLVGSLGGIVVAAAGYRFFGYRRGLPGTRRTSCAASLNSVANKLISANYRIEPILPHNMCHLAVVGQKRSGAGSF